MARLTLLVLLPLLLSRARGDLDVASDFIDETVSEGFQLEPLAQYPPMAGGPPPGPVRGEGDKRPIRERPPCDMTRANAGDVEAMYWCGWAHCHGQDGFIRNKAECMRLYQKAAEGGHPGAANTLGVAFSKGDGVAKDPVAAARWWQAAANAAHPPAMNNLAQAMVYGKGVDRDWETAMRLFHMAAEAGERGAMHNLGMAYQHGQPAGHVNIGLAKQWYERAALQGDPASAFALAALYESRFLDTTSAIHWYGVAKANGNKEASSALWRLGVQ